MRGDGASGSKFLAASKTQGPPKPSGASRHLQGPPSSEQAWGRWLVFSKVDPGGVWGVHGLLCERISGRGGLRAREEGSAAPNFSPL